MLEYLEKNYGNQFEIQRLNIYDLKLQVENYRNQLEAANNHLELKFIENDNLYKELTERKKGYKGFK